MEWFVYVRNVLFYRCEVYPFIFDREILYVFFVMVFASAGTLRPHRHGGTAARRNGDDFA